MTPYNEMRTVCIENGVAYTSSDSDYNFELGYEDVCVQDSDAHCMWYGRVYEGSDELFLAYDTAGRMVTLPLVTSASICKHGLPRSTHCFTCGTEL